MTKILIIILLTIGLIGSVKADTIDYWHVYYNKAIIKVNNQYSKGDILLKIKEIKKTDSLTIKYFSDTPCDECKTQVTIENRKHLVITKGNGLGTFNLIKISVYDLLQYQIKAGKDTYEVFYHKGQISSKTQRVLIFRIKLE